MPVTVEQFKIAMPNLVSRLSTNTEFSQILKFSVFLEIQDGGWQPSWLYSKTCNSFEPFEITKPNLVSRLSTNTEYSQILKCSVFLEIQDGGWQPSWLYSKAWNC